MIKRKEVVKILDLDSLAGGEKSLLQDCQLLDLSKVSALAITIRATHGSGATAALKVHLLASPDGSIFDTKDYTSFDADLKVGAESQYTVAITPDPYYLKVQVENPSGQPTATDIDVFAVLGFEE